MTDRVEVSGEAPVPSGKPAKGEGAHQFGLTAAAQQIRATQPDAFQPPQLLAEPLTATEQRILELLPTSTYLQMAATLGVSRNTVKTHLRSIYQKLRVASRSEAIQRAVELRLL